MLGFSQWWEQVSSIEATWLAIGLLGQGCFMMRFLFQWICSERARRSVIPVVFWYFSIGGSIMVLAYGVHRADPVIIIGQLTGTVIYARNLYFIWREGRETAVMTSQGESRSAL